MRNESKNDDSKNQPKFLDSSEVSSVVGIPPIYLNKFIERQKYGITPSIRAGEGRGSRRLFSERDVIGIALVWWLFESGLRPDMIQMVLNESIQESKRNVPASNAAWVLREAGVAHLAIQRQPRLGGKPRKSKGKQVTLMDLTDAGPSWFVETLGTGILLFIPLQNLFEQLSDSMNRSLRK